MQNEEDLQYLGEESEGAQSHRGGWVWICAARWRYGFKEKVCLEETDMPNRVAKGKCTSWSVDDEETIFV